MKISVATIASPSGRVTLAALEVPEGTTVREAAVRAGVDVEKVDAWAVFARKVAPDAVLHDGDRLDVGARLLVDPMTARRLRAQHKSTTPVPRPRHGGIHQLIKPLDV